jgi:predicted regulator of Ras-like GTPase activity (Roadblock/LC7/MglB family)
MDAAQALSELTSLSAQITVAIVLDADGFPLASTLDDARAAALAQTVQELLAAARRAADGGGRDLAQLEISTPAGSVFLVRDAKRTIAAATRPEPAAGLVFYDLKTCLRQIADRPKPKPKPRPRKKAGDATA